MRSALFPFIFSAAVLAGQGVFPGDSVVLVKGEIVSGHWNSGSGVVVAAGIVATNAHVLSGTQRCLVSKAGQSWPASVVRLDESRDLALLRIHGLSLPSARIADPESLTVGQRVTAIGFPGAADSVRRQGSLKARWSYLGGMLLQTDAPIAPGSSGGGLFAEDGTLLGITTFALPVGPHFNFAIPAHWAQELLASTTTEPIPTHRRETLLRTFLEAMNRDPANAGPWDTFTGEWVASAPGDPEAWFARSQAVDQRLHDQAKLGTIDATLLEAAVAASRTALRLRPGHARAWNNLGVALDLANDFAAAEAAFRRAVDLDPGYGLAWLNLGGALINQRAWADALRAYTHGLEQLPDHGAGWARKAFAESMLGRWTDAAAHFRIALRYNPRHLDLWKDLRQACLQSRDREGAALAEQRIALLAAER
jgi:Flp pilus assembly protein TadD